MQREIFEDTIRYMVARGSDIPPTDVVEDFQNVSAPQDILYASVGMLGQSTSGGNPHYQDKGRDRTRVITPVFAETRFQVDWFRDGAVDAAIRFRDWLRSESGVNWTASANVDGRIRSFSVYHGGSGYTDGMHVRIVHGFDSNGLPVAPEDAVQCEGTAQVGLLGSIYRIVLDKHGSHYRDIPTMPGASRLSDGSLYPVIEFVEPTGTGAQVGVAGFGLQVKNLDRLSIRRIPYIVDASDGQYEERATMDLVVCHTYLHIDEHAGRIALNVGDLAAREGIFHIEDEAEGVD